MRDSNDQVVSETLKAIAILVPILGATKVVGGKNRRKIFADGSPSKVKEHSRDHQQKFPELRQSPIGAESETSDEGMGAHDEWEPWQEDDPKDEVVEQNQAKNSDKENEPDFFADMEPVINTAAKVTIHTDKFASQTDWNDVDDEAWS